MLILLLLSLSTPIVALILFLLNKKTKFASLNEKIKQVIYGVIFGLLAILYCEIGFEVGGVVANIRDAAPLSAGLLFGAPAGIISGFIGGIYRYFAVFWGASEYTQIACTIATISAGFIAALCRKLMFHDKRPTWFYGVLITLTTEVLHMLLIFFTNMSDIETAFIFVEGCTIPMILSNVLAVLLGVIAISAASGELFKKKNKEKKHILQTFQLWLSICIALAFVCTILFTNSLQKEISNNNTIDTLESSIEDVKKEIKYNSDKNILKITNDVLGELNDSYSNAKLQQLTLEYDVSVVHIVNEEGIIIYSSDSSYLHFDMNSGSQAREFMVLVDGDVNEYVQAYQPSSINDDISMKYAGVKIDGVGFIQVGYDFERFQRDILVQVQDAARYKHVGKSGYVIICDKNFKVISGIESSEGQVLERDDSVSIHEYEVFEMKVQGVDSLCMFSKAEGYFIVSVIPESEAVFTREISNYVSGFIIILVFAALFVNVYFLVNKLVVSNLHKVNDSLSKITSGDLSVVVDVRENEEFNSLSNDINSTVDTLKHYIDEAASRIDKELRFAKLIQSSSLPSLPLLHNNFNIYANMFTAKEVGGDFYDYYYLNDNKVAFLVADVSGKGIPAAMFMMRSKTLMKNLAQNGLEVDEIFNRTNDELTKNNEADMFVTAWMGILDLNTGILSYANAGHNAPIMENKEGFNYLKSRPGFVLGGMENIKYIKNEIKLSNNDLLYLYTDGVTEANNFENELYGEERLINLLSNMGVKTVKEICENVKVDIDNFVGDNEQFDDITMLCFRYKKLDKIIKKSFKLKPEISDMEKIIEYLDNEFSALKETDKFKNQCNIVIDELYANIVKYSNAKEIKVNIVIDDVNISVEFKDDGKKFNPLEEVNDADINADLDSRKIGGLGIHIVKKMVDEITYEYENKCNCLKIIKRRNANG